MKINARPQAVYMFFGLAIMAILAIMFTPRPAQPASISLNQVAQALQDGSVAKIAVDGSNLSITYKDGTQAKAVKEDGTPLIKQLQDLGVTADQFNPDNVLVSITPPSPLRTMLGLLGFLFPFIVIGFIFMYIMRSSRGNTTTTTTSFGKSRARLMEGEHPNVTFEDVAGAEESKGELKEVVEFLREPGKFVALGARIPKGVLLVGSPGTGKTLLAKAVAGEAGVPFFSISGSEFVEMYVGVGASRVRDLFEQAKKHSPCIIFIDEIDAVGRHRGIGMGGGNDEREQTLNQMLVEMDGFNTDTHIIIIAATNRPDILDEALLRPGRFDRRVVLDRPDARGREEILKVHTKGKPLAPSVDLSKLARSIPGFVGADIENMVNEAAILAARNNRKTITQADLEEAVERAVAGPERKSRLITPSEKQVIAYHEAGHAIVMHALPKADPVHKITIVSRGMSLGSTIPRPTEDRTLESRERLVAMLIGLMGGRSAEELVFNDITSGASNDIERATEIARMMVTRLGMSDKLGLIAYGSQGGMSYLGRSMTSQRNYSDSVAEQIDQQVTQLVKDAQLQALNILSTYRPQLDAVAQRLMEVETLSQEEFEKLFPCPVEKRSPTPVMVA